METVTTASTVYTFTYDEFGNVTAIRAGDSLLASYTYGSNNGKLTTLTYGNGKVVQYTYDELDRVSEICYNDNEGVQHKYIYTYTASGAIHSVECTESGRKYQYNYNSRGQLTGYTELTASGNAYTDLAQSFFWYDDLNRLEYTQTSFRYAVGDYVWATDPETGVTELKQVTQLFRNETNEWIHVTVNGEEITCTPNHPFYSPVKGWTSACKLRAGDVLVTLNGEYVVVEQVQHELLESPEITYNFEVEVFHSYYAGAGVLTHNRNCSNPGRSGKQARLRELANDDKLSSSLRGEIKRDMNLIKQGKRRTIRVPKGYELAHRVGFSAKDGFSYAYSDLMPIDLHRKQHAIIYKLAKR